jgi:hydroxymethylglutaryl-CoA reductase
MEVLTGFSKLNITEKINILKKSIPLNDQQVRLLTGVYGKESETSDIIENLSENYVTNYSLPFSIAPNFLINDKVYFVPMVTEESSVVAAVSSSAKFWFGIGGFKSEITGTKKSGQIYFAWNGNIENLQLRFPDLKEKLLFATLQLTAKMKKRGGGITSISIDSTFPEKREYHIINVEFETADSMGANLINSCLETMGSELVSFIEGNYSGSESKAEVIMAILSNYTPGCIVECSAECDLKDLSKISGNQTPEQFAVKFAKAVQIAKDYIPRAVTHNKGIFNGVDAVLLATGNDFRAVEACGHAYAAREGKYTALTDVDIRENRFSLKLKMPLAVGTVGGATSVHPLAVLALQIMHNPKVEDLMHIVASAGLAANFSAVRSLITDGIQKGHMKLHLNNILVQLNTTSTEKSMAEDFFRNKQVSFSAVAEYIKSIRVNL